MHGMAGLENYFSHDLGVHHFLNVRPVEGMQGLVMEQNHCGRDAQVTYDACELLVISTNIILFKEL